MQFLRRVAITLGAALLSGVSVIGFVHPAAAALSPVGSLHAPAIDQLSTCGAADPSCSAQSNAQPSTQPAPCDTAADPSCSAQSNAQSAPCDTAADPSCSAQSNAQSAPCDTAADPSCSAQSNAQSAPCDTAADPSCSAQSNAQSAPCDTAADPNCTQTSTPCDTVADPNCTQTSTPCDTVADPNCTQTSTPCDTVADPNCTQSSTPCDTVADPNCTQTSTPCDTVADPNCSQSTQSAACDPNDPSCQNVNGATVPVATVQAEVAAGESGPAMPYERGFGLGADGGPPGPAPLARSIPSATVVLQNMKKTVKSNAGLAVLLLFLVGLPAMVFNAALKEHHHKLARKKGPFRRALEAIERYLGRLHGAVLLLAFAGIGAVLYALDDPTFGFNLGSLAEIIGYVGAIIVCTTVTEVLRGVYVHRRYEKVGDLKAFPVGIGIALIFDAFSRLSHFEPGYVFGILAAIIFRVKPTGDEDGKSTTLAYLWLFLVGFAAWMAYGPVNSQVIKGNHSFWLLVAESLLSYVWICGLQALFFSLMPVRHMDGEIIYRWSKSAWAAIYLTVTFIFVQFLIHPTAAGYGGNSHTSIFPLLAIFIVSGAAALAFWLYTHFKYGRVGTAEVGAAADTMWNEDGEPVSDTVLAGGDVQQ